MTNNVNSMPLFQTSKRGGSTAFNKAGKIGHSDVVKPVDEEKTRKIVMEVPHLLMHSKMDITTLFKYP